MVRSQYEKDNRTPKFNVCDGRNRRQDDVQCEQKACHSTFNPILEWNTFQNSKFELNTAAELQNDPYFSEKSQKEPKISKSCMNFGFLKNSIKSPKSCRTNRFLKKLMKILGQLLVLHDFGDFMLFFKNPKIHAWFWDFGLFLRFFLKPQILGVILPFCSRI